LIVGQEDSRRSAVDFTMMYAVSLP